MPLIVKVLCQSFLTLVLSLFTSVFRLSNTKFSFFISLQICCLWTRAEITRNWQDTRCDWNRLCFWWKKKEKKSICHIVIISIIIFWGVFKFKSLFFRELRLVESLDGICDRLLGYSIHKERKDSTRFAKGMSTTFKVLHGLVDKGVKVDLGMPEELWDKPSAEITHLKTQVYKLKIKCECFIVFCYLVWTFSWKSWRRYWKLVFQTSRRTFNPISLRRQSFKEGRCRLLVGSLEWKRGQGW